MQLFSLIMILMIEKLMFRNAYPTNMTMMCLLQQIIITFHCCNLNCTFNKKMITMHMGISLPLKAPLNSFDFCPTFIQPATNKCQVEITQLEEVFKLF